MQGLNALLATVTTANSAPVILAQRLRKCSCGSPRGADRLVADALKTVTTLDGSRSGRKPLLRADSAFDGTATVGAAIRGRKVLEVAAFLTVVAAVFDFAENSSQLLGLPTKQTLTQSGSDGWVHG